MIDLKGQAALGWNVLMAVSVISLPASAWYGFSAHSDPAQGRSDHFEQTQRLSLKARQDAEDARKTIHERTWSGDLNTLASKCLADLTVLADKNHLQVSGFRAEKAGDKAGMKEQPMVLVMEGSFQDLVSFIAAIEKPESRLAVELLQVSASDATPGGVTATVGLRGYHFGEEE